jgi:multicomponent Na+:H+ antiporter subunit E
VTHRTATWVLVLWLTAVWVGLWGSVTAANVLGGLAVAVVLVLLLPLPSGGGHGVVHPAALLRFGARFLVDLVVSSAQVATLVLRPRLALRQGVVAVPVPGASEGLLTLLGNAISLTPGTLTLDVDLPSSTLYVHALEVGVGPDGVDDLRRGLRDQAAAAVRAVGTPEARAQLGQSSSAPGDRRQERRP